MIPGMNLCVHILLWTTLCYVAHCKHQCIIPGRLTLCMCSALDHTSLNNVTHFKHQCVISGRLPLCMCSALDKPLLCSSQ